MNGKGHQVNDVNLQNQNELKLYTDILKTDDLQKRILFSFPNNNDENNIINDDKDNGENKDKGKVEVKNLDDLINIGTNIVNELLKQDRKKYPESAPQQEETEKKQNSSILFGYLPRIFCKKKQLVLPKDVDVEDHEVMNQCDKLRISYNDQKYILDGFIEEFSFVQLQVLTENEPTEDFVKLCVILWRFIDIDKKGYANAYTYRSSVIKKLTYSSKYRTTLYAFLDKIATVPNINQAFEKMKSINLNNMNLRDAVKEDFENFVGTLRECNLKIVIQNGCMKAVRDRELSLKKLVLAFGSAITGILTIMFIYNLMYVFIPISLGISVLLLVIAAVLNIVFAIINVRKKILHIPCMHTKLCRKECNLGFDLDCYDYPENETPEIEMSKQKGRRINRFR